MTDPKSPAPLELDASFLTPMAPAPPPLGGSDEVVAVDFPLVPVPTEAIPDAFTKHIDPAGAAAMRMMAARAMAPIPPKVLVPIVYQLLMDADSKIAAAAQKTFTKLDDKLLLPVAGEALPGQVLEALCHVALGRAACETLLLNKATPDAGVAWVAQRTEDPRVIGVIVENQERLLRHHGIVRGLKKNGRVLRSDLDKAIDFLVREGVFLEDVPEFEDSFLKLGKAEMLHALRRVHIKEEHLSEAEREEARRRGLTAEEYLASLDEQRQPASELSADEREALLDSLAEDDDEGGELDDEVVKELDILKTPFMKLPIPVQIKLAMTGPHEKAIEALSSSNRVVAGAGIRNPKIKEQDVVKVSRSRSAHEDVIRFICNNGDWTKGYAVKYNLIQNPKTPPSLVTRWLPLLRLQDLRALSKSKQVPSAVSLMAKRLLMAKRQ